MRSLTLAAGVFLLASLAGCGQFDPAALFQPNAVEQIRTRGELRVDTLNLPTCYYMGEQGPEGL